MVTEFTNEPLTDFTQDDNRRAMAQAIASVAEQLGQSYPMLIGGEKVTLDETFPAINPADPAEVVGIFPSGGAEHADRAVEAGRRAFDSWKRVSARQRADLLWEAADKLRRRKFEFAAWMCFEVGKNWAEADADVAEAIDFLRWYAREALRWDRAGSVTPIPGEENRLAYIPLGVGAIIPPWNFPCAIALGMATAAIAAGNTVVLKPAEQAPTIAWKFVEILQECGLPPGVLNFVTGVPEEVGGRLVEHPETRFIAFTGSKEVGLMINASAAQTRPGQKWIKRVIVEMGGKDAIVVDEDADVTAAIQGIVSSAFGYSGQKCSACSRAIIHEAVYDDVVAGVVEGAKALRIGPGIDHETQVGPVIDEDAVEKIMSYIEIGRQEGRLVLGGGGPEAGKGYFVEPTIFADVGNDARISREEIFGPVLALTKAKDFEQALEFANDTDYGLTGAVYSGNEAHLQKAAEDYFVGNLYFNRKCTGAMVGGHPFGGFNMSGTDSKAGGYDYLLLFLQAKLISRKV